MPPRVTTSGHHAVPAGSTSPRHGVRSGLTTGSHPRSHHPISGTFSGTVAGMLSPRKRSRHGPNRGGRALEREYTGNSGDKDLYEEQGEDHFFKHGRDIQGVNAIHRFTHTERERMRAYDTIEYWTPASQMMKRYNAEGSDRKEAGKRACNISCGPDVTEAFIYAMIGFVVGIVACLLLSSLEALFEWRVSLTKNILKSDDTSVSHRWFAFVPWYFSGLVCVAVSTMLCCVWPAAAGSGVPDVMAYLNGVVLPKVFNIKTLVMKVTSCALAVAGGLPVGPEGPMIHIGALVGAGVSSGRSGTLGCTVAKGQARRDNPRERREFITAGAAAGVACAFSAPIGGLLFVMEEVSSFFSKDALWMAFFSCLVAIFTFNTLATNVNGFDGRDGGDGGGCTSWAEWTSTSTILFKSNVLKNVNILSIIPMIVVGAVCGVFAIVFTTVNVKIVRWRARHINRSLKRRAVEPCVIFTLFTVISYAMVMATPCRTRPDALNGTFLLNYGRLAGELELFEHICDEPETQYHPLASLIFASPDDCVRLLMRRDPVPAKRDRTVGSCAQQYTETDPLAGERLFPYWALLSWLTLYFLFSCWSAGSFLASGIVIPMLTIGSLIGRILGLALVDLMVHGFDLDCDGVFQWVDPGTFAFIGAAAFFSGVSRLTFSLCVIMIELSSDLQQLPPLMIGVMVAKLVADHYTHSLYHALLEVKCVPFLDYDCKNPYIDLYSAGHLMSKVTDSSMFKIKGESVKKVSQVLEAYKHNGFPVVGIQIKPGRFKGLVTRRQLILMLHFIDTRYKEFLASPDYQDREAAAAAAVDEVSDWTYEELVNEREKLYKADAADSFQLWPLDDPMWHQTVDLTHIVNTSTFSVPKNFCVTATYTLFRSMGLRHLVVVNAANQVAGIITRKDLIAQSIEERTVSRVTVPVTKAMMGGGVLDEFINELQDTSCRGHTVLIVTRMPPSPLWADVVGADPPLIRPRMHLIQVNNEMVESRADVWRAMLRAPDVFDVEFVPHCNLHLNTKDEVKDAISRMVTRGHDNEIRRRNSMVSRINSGLSRNQRGSQQYLASRAGTFPCDSADGAHDIQSDPLIRRCASRRTGISLPTNDLEDSQDEEFDDDILAGFPSGLRSEPAVVDSQALQMRAASDPRSVLPPAPISGSGPSFDLSSGPAVAISGRSWDPAGAAGAAGPPRVLSHGGQDGGPKQLLDSPPPPAPLPAAPGQPQTQRAHMTSCNGSTTSAQLQRDRALADPPTSTPADRSTAADTIAQPAAAALPPAAAVAGAPPSAAAVGGGAAVAIQPSSLTFRSVKTGDPAADPRSATGRPESPPLGTSAPGAAGLPQKRSILRSRQHTAGGSLSPTLAPQPFPGSPLPTEAQRSRDGWGLHDD